MTTQTTTQPSADLTYAEVLIEFHVQAAREARVRTLISRVVDAELAAV